MEALNANKIPIKKILEKYNCYPAKSYGNYEMYCSPFREDTTPSFQVLLEKNIWKDHGSGEFGSAVDLVMKIEKCGFLEAMRIFENETFGNHAINSEQPISKPTTPKVSSQVVKTADLQNKTLLSYMKQERGIDQDIAMRFCKEVYYKRENSDKNLFAVAFLNDSGGLEYRNGAGYKGAFINKDITTINNNSNQCAVFEGFIDFLTYQQLMKGKEDKLNIDFVILNSVAMLERALPFITKHERINCFLDNDPAGNNALSKIKRNSATKVINESQYLFADKKDLNEFWVDQLKKKQNEFLTKNHTVNVEPPKKKGFTL